MGHRLHSKMAFRRKLRILRSLASSKPVKKKSTIMDALVYIYGLKLQLDALKKELSYLTEIRRQCFALLMKKKITQLPWKEKVKVDKAGNGYKVRVMCEKGEDHKLVKILEAFEEMGLVALQAKVSCNFYFNMEAIVEAQEQGDEQKPPSPSHVDAEIIARAILEAIEAPYVGKEKYQVGEVP